MKILIFIDHDIVVRHFLHSKVFCGVEAEHDVVYVLPERGHKRLSSTESNLSVEGARIRRIKLNEKRLALWQKLNVTEMIRFKPGKQHRAMRSFHRATLGFKGVALYGFLGLPIIYGLFQLYVRMRILFDPCVEITKLLKDEKPDLIIHPSVLAGLFINDLVDILPKHKIPLLVIMNSWDNPSTKRAMFGNPDWLLVWGPQTRHHAIKYMGMAANRVINFGAAQFDVYRSQPTITRKEFMERHNISEGYKVLLYAGSSKDTDEYYHLSLIDNAIELGLLKQVVVIYRPHPWGSCGKGGHRIHCAKWKHVRVESSMKDYVKNVSDGVSMKITTPSYLDTHNILSHVDALVSPLSTIVIEGALHGKPSLCFLPDEVDASGHYKQVLPLTHFEEFFSSSEFMFVEGDKNLVPAIKNLLVKIDDQDYSVRLKKACSYFVSPFDSAYDDRLLQFIDENFSESE